MISNRSALNLLMAVSFSIIFVFLANCSTSTSSNSDSNSDDKGFFSASRGLTVTIINNSGRTAYIKFAGNPLTINKNDASINSGSSTDFNLSSVTSGRIYISYDKALSSNAPDGANSADSDYKTRFDKVELTYGQGGKANLTAVDFYSIPMILETSIQGTTIEHLTLADGKTGKAIEAALVGVIADTASTVIKGGTSGTETVRILSPVKSPGAYDGFDNYLNTLIGATLSIAGTYYGTPSQNYNYTGSILADSITLSEGANTIKITNTSLMSNNADLINFNGIYTCNGAYAVNGITHDVSQNDLYAAVYRDLVTAFNLGFVKTGANDSTTWWQSTPFQGTSYNKYAKVISDNYPGAYGFPFTDRFNHILADLGGKIDKMTITLLDDNTSPAPYTPQGIINPQAGVVTFNLILVTADSNFKNTKFTFDTQTYTGGNSYTFPANLQGAAGPDGKTAQISNVPAQNGLNIYQLLLRGKKYSVFLKVDGGTVSWGSITGGADASWSKPNLFIGGLN